MLLAMLMKEEEEEEKEGVMTEAPVMKESTSDEGEPYYSVFLLLLSPEEE